MTGNRRNARPKAAKKGTRVSGSKGAGSAGGTAGKRIGKYNAHGEHVDGKWMASAAEAERYRQLLRLEMVGAIGNLVTQPVYDLVVNNRTICRYRADFRYDVVDDMGGVLRTIVEDIKGFETPDFRIKLALFNALVVPELTLVKPGQIKASRALFIAQHWDGVLPAGHGEFKVPCPAADVIGEAKAGFSD